MFGHLVYETSEWLTDSTEMLIAILCMPTKDEVAIMPKMYEVKAAV